MLPIHDPFTHEMCDRLKTTCMGLGLVRLLQDAKRFDEAKTTLALLENGFQTNQNPCQASRLKGVAKTVSRSSKAAATRIDAAQALTQPLSMA